MASVSVEARIQAVPERADLAAALRDSLAPLPAEIVYDTGETKSPLRGYRRCLEDTGASHLLVIQDDAVVCRNFAEAVTRIAAANTVPVVLFFPGARVCGLTFSSVLSAMKHRRPYVDLHFRDLMPAVAVLWPSGLLPSLRSYIDANPLLKDGREALSDDAKLGEWRRDTKQPVRVTVPSLVQHPDMEPSVVNVRKYASGKDKGRVAMFFVGDGDALDITW